MVGYYHHGGSWFLCEKRRVFLVAFFPSALIFMLGWEEKKCRRVNFLFLRLLHCGKMQLPTQSPPKVFPLKKSMLRHHRSFYVKNGSVFLRYNIYLTVVRFPISASASNESKQFIPIWKHLWDLPRLLVARTLFTWINPNWISKALSLKIEWKSIHLS